VDDGGARRTPVDLDAADVGLREAEDHVDGRRLAGTARTEERDDLARLEGQVEAVDGDDRAEALRQPAEAMAGVRSERSTELSVSG
jgi:hypothetical protein